MCSNLQVVDHFLYQVYHIFVLSDTAVCGSLDVIVARLYLPVVYTVDGFRRISIENSDSAENFLLSGSLPSKGDRVERFGAR